MTKLFRAFWSINPIWGSAISLCAGLLTVIASFPLHLAFVTYKSGDLTKQVGFIPSLNWSLVLVFLFPAAIFAGQQTARHLVTTFRDLPYRHMLARGDWTPATSEDAEALLSDVWRAGAPIGIFFFVLVLAVGAWDFSVVVLDPLLKGALPIAPGQTDFERELDWSIAALFAGISDDPRPSVAANLAFSAVAHLLLLSQIAYLLSFYGILIGLSAVLYRFAEDRQPVRLTPDVTSTDRRRGFQRFSGFFMGALTVSVLAYISCYFMRVQNLYLRDGEAGRVDQLMFNYIAGSLSEKIYVPHDIQSFLYFLANSALEISNAVFATGDLGDVQAYLGVGMILIGVLVVVVALFTILRGAAEEAGRGVERALADGATTSAVTSYYGLPAEVVAERVGTDGMDEWPLKWPRLNTFLAYTALGLACFFFYRLALVWIAIQVWYLLQFHPREKGA